MQKLRLFPLVLVLLPPPASSAAEPTNAAPARSTTLQECFDLALKYNLDLQIERINPGLSLMDLNIARAGYDPNFTASAVQSYSLSGGSVFIDTNNAQITTPGSKIDTHALNSGISGLAPLGLLYNLSGSATESYTTAAKPSDFTFGSVGLSLTQPLLKNLLIDTTRWNILVAKNRIKYSDLHLRQQIISILTAVEQA